MSRYPADFPDAIAQTYRRPGSRKRVYILRRRRKPNNAALRIPFPSGQLETLPTPHIIQGIPSTKKWVGSVAAKHSVSDSHRHRIAGTLQFLMERATEKPDISSEDNELFVEWRYALKSLELSIPDTDQEIYVRITDERGTEIKLAFVNRVSEEERDVAASISQLIDESRAKGS